MRVFGNLANRIAETAKPQEPTVGMGATILLYSDRTACTIIRVEKKFIRVQEDTSKRVDNNGMSESQDYEYSPNPTGQIKEYSKRKNGAYVKVGEPMHNGTVLRIGVRDSYYDFGF